VITLTELQAMHSHMMRLPQHVCNELASCMDTGHRVIVKT